jgi:hypothetical protein
MVWIPLLEAGGGGGSETAKLRITGVVAYLHSIVSWEERLYVSLGKRQYGRCHASRLFFCFSLFAMLCLSPARSTNRLIINNTSRQQHKTRD